MIQNPKGGGLDSSLGGSTNIGGVQNTNKFLDNSTWTLAIVLIVLILLSSISFSSGYSEESKLLEGQTPVAAPVTNVPPKAIETQPAKTAPAGEATPATTPEAK